MNEIKIGKKYIGKNHPCFIAAEVGINHNGDMNLAHQLIDEAARIGADAVKFQNYKTADFLSDKTLLYEYISQNKSIVESQFDMFTRCELTKENLIELKQHCDEKQLIFFSTPTGEEGLKELLELNVPILKNGSDYLVNLPLIKAMANTGIPTIISTGMATLAEIDDAVQAFKSSQGKELIILHCISSYPTPPADVHLRKIKSLAYAFGVPIGFSDHTAGSNAAIAAVAFGACFIEKHFTLDKNLPGPDHRFSCDPEEFRLLIQSVREIELMFGKSVIEPTETEAKGRVNFRLSCTASKTLNKGHVLKSEDVVFNRPATGLPPKSIDWLIGKTVRNDIIAGKILDLSDF